jgi:hypothetical protein
MIEDPSFKVVGTLIVKTDPKGATVFLDGRKRGKTPLNIELPIKNYDLKIQKEGFADHIETIKIAEASTTTINKKLTVLISSPKMARITINTDPSGAAVFINGESIGTTPLEHPNITLVSHQILIKKAGYFNIDFPITLNSDTSIYKVLVPSGRLTINTIPSGAEIFVNNIKQDSVTPLDNDQMKWGEYNIMIKLKYYKPYTEIVRLSINERIKNIEKKLEKLYSTITIEISPVAGSIYIDGKLFMDKVTRIPAIKIPYGKHLIKIESPSYESEEREIIIEDDNPQVQEFKLNKKVN